jgi:transposase
MNPWLLEMLEEYGCREIVVTQPTARSKQKTDRRDAGVLGHLLWVHRQQFLDGKHPLGVRRIQPPTPQEADDRQLTALRARLTKKRTAVLNGIHKILRKHNLEQECPTKVFQTQKVRRWLTEMELPALDRLEMNLLLPQWELLDEQLEAVEVKIAERAAADEQAKLLESMPGMGHYSALAIASRIGDIKRFKRPDSLANYFGLTPSCRNSGEATQRLGSITKQGSKMVRCFSGASPRTPEGFNAASSERNGMVAQRTRVNRLAHPHSSPSPDAALGSVPTVALSSASGSSSIPSMTT